MNFIQVLKDLDIALDHCAKQVRINYAPSTNRPVFDICDLNGRILKTGQVTKGNTVVDVCDLIPDQYILLVLDGDCISSKRFRL